jgi:hypothetical protein
VPATSWCIAPGILSAWMICWKVRPIYPTPYREVKGLHAMIVKTEKFGQHGQHVKSCHSTFSSTQKRGGQCRVIKSRKWGKWLVHTSGGETQGIFLLYLSSQRVVAKSLWDKLDCQHPNQDQEHLTVNIEVALQCGRMFFKKDQRSDIELGLGGVMLGISNTVLRCFKPNKHIKWCQSLSDCD